MIIEVLRTYKEDHPASVLGRVEYLLETNEELIKEQIEEAWESFAQENDWDTEFLQFLCNHYPFRIVKDTWLMTVRLGD